jgi:hypothetical protein
MEEFLKNDLNLMTNTNHTGVDMGSQKEIIQGNTELYLEKILAHKW